MMPPEATIPAPGRVHPTAGAARITVAIARDTSAIRGGVGSDGPFDGARDDLPTRPGIAIARGPLADERGNCSLAGL